MTALRSSVWGVTCSSCLAEGYRGQDNRFGLVRVDCATGSGL